MGQYFKQFGMSHYTQQVRVRPHPIFAVEEEFMDENMSQWIAQGKDGWYVAILGREVVGMWPTWTAAAAWQRADPRSESVYFQRIQEWQKLLVGIIPYATPDTDVQER